MKADDARKRTEQSAARKREAAAEAERKRLANLDDARDHAKKKFDSHYECVVQQIGEAADGGHRSTDLSYTAYLDKDGSHGWKHAYETELAKLTERKLRADGYKVEKKTESKRIQANEGQDEQAVCIDLEISW